IQRDTGWVVEARVRRRTAIAQEGVEAIAHHGGDDPRRRSDLANAVVALVRDVQIAARIQRDTDWAVKARARRRTAIAREVGAAIARHRGDDPCRGLDFANSMVAVVRDVQIAARIQLDADWAVSARGRRLPPLAS